MSDIIRDHGISSRNHCLANLAITLIMILYFCACFIFELLDPVLTFRFDANQATIDWVSIFYEFYYLRFVFDFIACMLILFLLYKIGPSSNAVLDAQQTSSTNSGNEEEPTTTSGAFVDVVQLPV